MCEYDDLRCINFLSFSNALLIIVGFCVTLIDDIFALVLYSPILLMVLSPCCSFVTLSNEKALFEWLLHRRTITTANHNSPVPNGLEGQGCDDARGTAIASPGFGSSVVHSLHPRFS